jgi:hypothetical protein
VDKVMAQLRKQPKFNLKFNCKVKKVTRLVGKVAATFFSSEKNQDNTVLGKKSSQPFINSTCNIEADQTVYWHDILHLCLIFAISNSVNICLIFYLQA